MSTETKAVHAPGPLEQVKVGDLVWLDSDYGWGDSQHTQSRMAEITHIDRNGRLFICEASAKDFSGKGKLLIENWRYGFDPKSGEAHHYVRQYMKYATPEEIAEEGRRLQESIDKREAVELEQERIERIRSAAPEMLEALRNMVLLSQEGPDAFENPLEVIVRAREAIAKAEGAL